MQHLTQDDLKEIFLNGEGPQIEFKTRLPRHQELGKLISAFANTNGGILVVGYNEDKKCVVGIDSDYEKLIKQSVTMIDNPPRIDVYSVEYQTKKLLIISVLKNSTFISFFNGSPYIRKADRTLLMNKEEIKQIANGVSNEQLLDAIGKLSEQNENLINKLDKSSRDSLIFGIITCIVSAVIGWLLGKYL